jgi:hypothetical protein
MFIFFHSRFRELQLLWNQVPWEGNPRPHAGGGRRQASLPHYLAFISLGLKPDFILRYRTVSRDFQSLFWFLDLSEASPFIQYLHKALHP